MTRRVHSCRALYIVWSLGVISDVGIIGAQLRRPCIYGEANDHRLARELGRGAFAVRVLVATSSPRSPSAVGRHGAFRTRGKALLTASIYLKGPLARGGMKGGDKPRWNLIGGHRALTEPDGRLCSR